MNNYTAIQNGIADVADTLTNIDSLGYGHDRTVELIERILHGWPEADIRALRRVLRQFTEAADKWKAPTATCARQSALCVCGHRADEHTPGCGDRRCECDTFRDCDSIVNAQVTGWKKQDDARQSASEGEQK